MIQLTFDEVYKKWYTFVYRVCFKFLKDEYHAVTNANDTFLVVNDLIKLHQFDNELKLKGFMAITARNKCRNFIKNQRARYNVPIILKEVEPEEYEQSIENQLIYSEVVNALYKQVQELPCYARRVFIMWLGKGDRSNIELAKQLNISINTFNCLKQKATNHIKRLNGFQTPDWNLPASLTGRYKARKEKIVSPETGTSMLDDVLNFARINQYLMTTQEIGEEMIIRYPVLTYDQIRRWLRNAGIKPVTKGDFYREFIHATKCTAIEFAEHFKIDPRVANNYLNTYS